MKSPNPTIFNRLFLSFMAVSLFLIGGAILAYYQFSVRQSEASIRAEFREFQRNHIAQFERAYLTPLENTLSMMYISSALAKIEQVSLEERTLVRFEIERAFQRLVKLSNGNYQSVRYINASGLEQVIVEGNRRIRIYQSLLETSEEHQRQHLASMFRELSGQKPGTVLFGEPHLGNHQRMHFYAGIALSEPDVGGFGGAVIIENDLGEFQHHTESTRFRGYPVAHLAIADQQSRVPPEEADLVSVASLHRGLSTLHVEFRLPQEIQNHQIRAITFSAIGALALSLIGILAIATWMANAISRPLRNLANASRLVASGDFTPITTQSRFHELVELTESFNAMSLQLQSTLAQLNRDIEQKTTIQRDLKEHKENLERLVTSRTHEIAELNNMIRLVLDTIPIRVFWKDRDLVYLGCNRHFAEDAGFSTPDELIGKTDHAMAWREQAELYRGDDQQVIDSGQPRLDYEEPQTTPDGNTIWLRTSKIPLRDASGAIIGVLGFYEDITSRKQVEIERDNARQEAMRANEAKSIFLANMSHEIRTPMNAITGMMHLAMQSGLNETQADYINKAQRSAESLLSIINDILDFSKVEAGMLELEEQPFKVAQVITNTTNLVKLKALEHDIQIETILDKQVPAVLVGDSVRLGQVLINLASNAVKFSPSGGKVTIRVENRHQDDDQVELKLSITDQGIGMDKAQIERLFKPFTQADASTSRRYGGTGLGLAIARQITQLMGGEIWAESRKSVGSTFFFTVKLRPAEQHELEKHGDESNDIQLITALSALRGTRVLLVEDNDLNQELARELLTYEDIEVETANNGKQALELLSKQRFDGVLMDCQMPVMDGYEATRRIREQEKFRDLPIIAMTANVMQEDIEKALASGMNEHIAKPIDPNKMFITMAKLIGRKT